MAQTEALPRLTIPPTLRDLKMAVHTAKANRDRAAYTEHVEKARAVNRWEADGNALGSNEATRADNRTIAQAEDGTYQAARRLTEAHDAILADCEAALAAYLDMRKMDYEAVLEKVAESSSLVRLS